MVKTLIFFASGGACGGLKKPLFAGLLAGRDRGVSLKRRRRDMAAGEGGRVPRNSYESLSVF